MSSPQQVEPLLSVCIPTFNRAANLRSLFQTLVAVRQRFGSEVEFCVSNNASEDGTREVIEEFALPLGLQVVHQSRNIGGTLNIIAVAQMVRGRWGMFLGDDDELVADAIAALLQELKRAEPPTIWILVESADPTGRPQYLARFREGTYSAAELHCSMLRLGLNTFGFMGVHVFPRAAVATFNGMDLTDAQPWPHTACMLRETSARGAQVFVLKKAVTIQATDAKLFWAGGDLAKIRLDKVRVVMRAYRRIRRGYFFYHLMMLRELYAGTTVKSLLAWRLYEPGDFNQRAVATYIRAYCWLGLCTPLALPHALLLSLLRIVPGALYAALFRLIGKGHLLTDYQALKRDLGMFDGIKRGI